ncbi:unnamed protein product [Caenorhabditis angaria]|uniref:Uncharacterized protein n=1 Tax=Caenorhabditis angaria TaxID=860376 RepID=A0A9P1ITV1_9PELO|nr:unnamed protein product [Caenorhabditis angaria]
MFRYYSIFLIGIFIDAAPSEKRESAIVPIFGNYMTIEPITFTFTTPIARTFPTLVPSKPKFVYEVQTPIVSAQNYKFNNMKSSMQQDAYATYRSLWKNFKDTWNQMQNDIYSSPRIHQDWRQFWRDFSQTIEPYVKPISGQLTSIFNVFLKHQQEKE